VDDHGGNDENNPNEGCVNRAKVVNEETRVNRAGVVIQETCVNREEVVNDVFRNTLPDDTMKDAISEMSRDAELGILIPKQLEKLEKMRKYAKIPLYMGCIVSN